MKNVKISLRENGMISIDIDTNQNFGPSKSGKTTIIASTEGNQPILLPDGTQVIIGLNVYKH